MSAVVVRRVAEPNRCRSHTAGTSVTILVELQPRSATARRDQRIRRVVGMLSVTATVWGTIESIRGGAAARWSRRLDSQQSAIQLARLPPRVDQRLLIQRQIVRVGRDSCKNSQMFL